MAMVSYGEGLTWQSDQGRPVEAACETSVWEEVATWLALLPTLFITVGGRIQTDTGPVAFRFTAMEEDSIYRKLARLTCSLLILLLLSTRFGEILTVCKKSKLLLLLPVLAFVSALWSQNPLHTLVDAPA